MGRRRRRGSRERRSRRRRGQRCGRGRLPLHIYHIVVCLYPRPYFGLSRGGAHTCISALKAVLD